MAASPNPPRLGEAVSGRSCVWSPVSASGSIDIAEPARGLDDVDAELLAQTADEDLDGVGIAVEILVVEMLDDLAARDDPPRVMHQIGEQPIFVAGQLDRDAVDGHAAGARVEPDRAGDELARRMAGGAAQQRADAREHFLHVEGLGDVVVGAGVEALHLVAPAIARGEDQHRHRSGPPCARPRAPRRRRAWAGRCRARSRRRARCRRGTSPPRRRRRGRPRSPPLPARRRPGD